MSELIATGDRCDRCGFDQFVDVVLRHAPHSGRSSRRDCAHCGKTLGFPVWYRLELTRPTEASADGA